MTIRDIEAEGFARFEEENDNSKCFGPRLVYNIISTEDNSFDFDKSLGLVQDESNIVTIYQNENKDFQEDIDFGYMKKIIYCKNAKLINMYTNEVIEKSDFLEFSDVLGNCFYLDCFNNKLYKRYNCFKLEKNNDKSFMKEEYNMILMFRNFVSMIKY